MRVVLLFIALITLGLVAACGGGGILTMWSGRLSGVWREGKSPTTSAEATIVSG